MLPTPQRCPSITSETEQRISSEGQVLSCTQPTQINLSFWSHHCPVFGQPLGQDEQAGTDGTHFGDPQESPFSVVCGLPATLQAEVTFRLAPKEVTVFALGPEPSSTPVRLRTRTPLSQSRSPPKPNCPTLLFKRDTQAALLAPVSQLPVPDPVGVRCGPFRVDSKQGGLAPGEPGDHPLVPSSHSSQLHPSFSCFCLGFLVLFWFFCKVDALLFG